MFEKVSSFHIYHGVWDIIRDHQIDVRKPFLRAPTVVVVYADDFFNKFHILR